MWNRHNLLPIGAVARSRVNRATRAFKGVARRSRRIARMGKRGALIGALVVVAVVVVGAGGYWGYRQFQATAYNDRACAAIEQQIADRGEVVRVPGDGPRVAVIGDSYSSGDGLDDYTQAWPFLFASQTGDAVSIAAVGWTGFTAEGVCGDQAFSTRAGAARGADIVIVQGGLNDARGGLDVEATASALLNEIDAPRVIVVGPVDAPSIDGEGNVDEQLRSAAVAAGAEYVSTIEWDVEFIPGDDHMTEHGHADYATRLLEAIS